MTDYSTPLGEGAFGGEPARDVRLGQLLRDELGATPTVDWDRLAARITTRVADQASSSWWSYAARWERSAVPIALAAGFVGAMLLLNTQVAGASTSAVAPDLFAEVVSGTSPDEAVRFYSRAVTSTAADLATKPE